MMVSSMPPFLLSTKKYQSTLPPPDTKGYAPDNSAKQDTPNKGQTRYHRSYTYTDLLMYPSSMHQPNKIFFLRGHQNSPHQLSLEYLLFYFLTI